MGIRDNIEVEDMYFLGGILILCGLIKLELIQKKRRTAESLKEITFKLYFKIYLPNFLYSVPLSHQTQHLKTSD